MSISIFDLFSIGIGPSSSHTVGPMLAANAFLNQLISHNKLSTTTRVQVNLYGSLALTGKGHGTDHAILNGLEGANPETVDPKIMPLRTKDIIASQRLNLAAQKIINFHPHEDLLFLQKERLPKHSNGMGFYAFDANGESLLSQIYYSIGGGFIVTDEDFGLQHLENSSIPYPFADAHTLIHLCKQHNLSIAELMFKNELTWRQDQDIYAGIKNIANIMRNCITNGCNNHGTLPGGLNLKRRAPELYNSLQNMHGICSLYEQSDIMNRLNVYAMAVNEENAAGGRIVTAPTNGAAGIIPAVLRYAEEAHAKTQDNDLYTYFLTSAAIGLLYKQGASISGAEMGCQGEVGVASSMAAAGLTAMLGGNLLQIENAAEIAMEHHLGMTCDPVMSLVQIPCIERNAMGAVKAVNAARLALMGDGSHRVSLDHVIKTMKQTGIDMQSIYKETSLGGLAVNFPEC